VPPLPADQQPDAAEQAEEARQEGQVELHEHHQEAGKGLFTRNIKILSDDTVGWQKLKLLNFCRPTKFLSYTKFLFCENTT
jgi:hypothetical protein